MKKLEKKEIMNVELDMLIVFDKLCKENNLYYSLCGGTLLGAVRHKGFIPWDDDIDVLMPRPDFEQLKLLIKNKSLHLPKHLEFISWFTDPAANIPFIKMIDKRTKVVEQFMEADKNLWIDILVTDACPDDENELRKMFKKSKKLRKLLFLKQTKPGTGKSSLKVLEKSVARLILKPISSRSLCQKLEKLSSKYDVKDCKYIGGIEWGYGPQERVDKDSWLKPIELEFEGHMFWAPSNYEEYLSNLYGDYMKLPPLEKRTSHDMDVEM